MFKIGINQNLCRLCGCKNENGQSLSDENNAELLTKVRTTFSAVVRKISMRFQMQNCIKIK